MIEHAYTDDYAETESGLLVPKRRGPLRAVDLFCGAGGFSLGMEQAGIDVVGALEWTPEAGAAGVRGR